MIEKDGKTTSLIHKFHEIPINGMGISLTYCLGVYLHFAYLDMLLPAKAHP